MGLVFDHLCLSATCLNLKDAGQIFVSTNVNSGSKTKLPHTETHGHFHVAFLHTPTHYKIAKLYSVV